MKTIKLPSVLKELKYNEDAFETLGIWLLNVKDDATTVYSFSKKFVIKRKNKCLKILVVP